MHGWAQSMPPCLWYMFLFQLPTILFNPPLQQIRVTTPSESWLDFAYCLLQKIKKASSLPLVEQWEEYFVPNHLRFPAIDDKNFLVGTHVMTALGKVGIHHLQTDFHPDARRFLEDFVNCVLSTVAARSVIGQGLSCLCPAIVVWWGRCCSFTTLQQTCGRAAREGLDEVERGRGVPGWVPVLCAGTKAAGAVIHEEPPWHRWRPVVLFCTG